MDLHTDGTYVKEITDWLLMTKIEEINMLKVVRLQCLHLDEWEHCEDLYKDPVGQNKILYGALQKVKI